MITKLILEYFTVFEKLELDLSPGVNVIIGKNGTGKTHVLKVIYSLLAANNKAKKIIGPLGTLDALDKLEGVFLPYRRDYDRLIRRVNKGRKGTEKANITIKFKSEDRPDDITIEIKLWRMNAPKSWVSSPTVEPNAYPGKLVYIPVKEMLANAPGFRSLYSERKIHFEEVYDDILIKAYLPELRKLPSWSEEIVRTIEKTIGGKIILKNEEFFLETPNGNQIEFTLVAEGWRKLALLLLLIKNGCIGKGSLLLWDEPESNMNPLLISLLVDILLKLEQEGVQIVLATHSYVLLKEFDLQRREKHRLLFHALFEEGGQIKSQSTDQMSAIESNAIHEEFDSLYDREVERALNNK